jgi:parallel beta-helix repeat protein
MSLFDEGAYMNGESEGGDRLPYANTAWDRIQISMFNTRSLAICQSANSRKMARSPQHMGLQNNSKQIVNRIAGMGVCVLLAFGILLASAGAQTTKPFQHPGMLQTRENLEFMRQKVNAGEEPWKSSYDKLLRQATSSLDFQPKPIAHIVRGPYGRPSIGDRDLTASANAAYSQAIQWVITGDKTHAQKAIEIINVWSGTLWDFEDNDAKLLAAWTGHVFCNAAEILRYTNSGWKESDVAQFQRMLLTVYYPLIKDFYPEANGNWDAAMMDTMLCIGVFCDDRAIFDRAVEHFVRGEGNAGITKYIYPSGQCEESTRDQSHTQLGLGELAQACDVAWTQGVDLFGVADNRLALGVEYTARYILGEDLEAYGKVSAQGRGRFSDIYEGVYQHYHFVKGLEMPYTAKAIAKARAGTAWSALTLFQRETDKTPALADVPHKVTSFEQAGAIAKPGTASPHDSIHVAVGEDIQKALDACASGGCVDVAVGVFLLPAPLRMPSGVTLAGQGLDTTLMLDPKLTVDRAGMTIVNSGEDMHDVTLRDFVVEGAATSQPTTNDPNQDRRQRSFTMAPNRAGIVFNAQHEGQMRNLLLEHLTVRNCSHNGVAIRGATEVTVASCDFSDDGARVVPGPGLQHNLLLSHVANCKVSDSRLDTSPWGSGLQLIFSSNVTINHNEVARNALCGVHVADSSNVRVTGNMVEGNDRDGIAFDALASGCTAVEVSENLSRNNGGQGIRFDQVKGGSPKNNSLVDNGEQ